MYMHELLQIDKMMKIRRYFWSKELYIQVDESGNYFEDQKDCIYDISPDDILVNDWFQYE